MTIRFSAMVLRRLLEAESDLKVIGEACDGTEAVRMARQLKPDIMLLDSGHAAHAGPRSVA